MAEEEKTEERYKGVSEQIEEALLAGVPKEVLVAQGFNPNSVRTVASELRGRLGEDQLTLTLNGVTTKWKRC